MRISPVTGDLPAVATLTEPAAPPPPHEEQAAPAVAPVASTAGGSGAGMSDQRRESPPQAFDPPLIAQRAVLGLPVGMLIAELAEAEKVPYMTASAAVDREMPQG